MTPTEVEVGARVKEFRERIEWPQTIFAYEVGLTRNQLASVEHGLTPLRYGVAARICKRYQVSALWLAKGVGCPQCGWLFGDADESPVPHKMLFSEAFSRHLEPALSEGLVNHLRLDEATGATQSILPPFDVPSGHQHEWYVLKAFRAAVESIPPESRAAFCDAVLIAIARELLKLSATSESGPPLRASAAKSREAKEFLEFGGNSSRQDILDSGEGGPIVGGVTSKVPTWAELKKEIVRLTAEHGMKAWLADELKLSSRQVLTNWLSTDDQGRPDAQNTLLLLRWVKGGGGKTKIPRK